MSLTVSSPLSELTRWEGKRWPVGMCQKFARTALGWPPAGDVDGDGDADAVDAWKAARVKTTYSLADVKRLPRIAAVYWSGGSAGHGHAAPSMGKGAVMSTDRPRGFIGRASVAAICRDWDMHLLGVVWVDGHGNDVRSAWRIRKDGAKIRASDGRVTGTVARGHIVRSSGRLVVIGGRVHKELVNDDGLLRYVLRTSISKA